MIRFSAFKTLAERTAFVIATGFGSGLSPKAPGTFGSAAALLLIFFFQTYPVPPSLQWLVWSLLFVLGTWAAGKVDQVLDSSDHSQIVIDEFVGMAIAASLANGQWTALLLSFCLFRFFDILKPPPVRQLDRWSKKRTGKPGTSHETSNVFARGLGVMVDDLAAGLQALFIFWLLSVAEFF